MCHHDRELASELEPEYVHEHTDEELEADEDVREADPAVADD